MGDPRLRPLGLSEKGISPNDLSRLRLTDAERSQVARLDRGQGDGYITDAELTGGLMDPALFQPTAALFSAGLRQRSPIRSELTVVFQNSQPQMQAAILLKVDSDTQARLVKSLYPSAQSDIRDLAYLMYALRRVDSAFLGRTLLHALERNDPGVVRKLNDYCCLPGSQGWDGLHNYLQRIADVGNAVSLGSAQVRTGKLVGVGYFPTRGAAEQYADLFSVKVSEPIPDVVKAYAMMLAGGNVGAVTLVEYRDSTWIVPVQYGYKAPSDLQLTKVERDHRFEQLDEERLDLDANDPRAITLLTEMVTLRPKDLKIRSDLAVAHFNCGEDEVVQRTQQAIVDVYNSYNGSDVEAYKARYQAYYVTAIMSLSSQKSR